MSQEISSSCGSHLYFKKFGSSHFVKCRFYLADNADFTNPVMVQELENFLVSVPDLPDNKEYFWKVAVLFPDATIWSDVFTFNTYDPTKIPVLISPWDQTENNPVDLNFEWTHVEGRLSYSFYLSDDIAFSNLITSRELLTANNTFIQGLENNKQYFWKVKAVFEDGQTWSSVYNFKNSFTSAITYPTIEWKSG